MGTIFQFSTHLKSRIYMKNLSKAYLAKYSKNAIRLNANTPNIDPHQKQDSYSKTNYDKLINYIK